ncbi:LysR family transcriptional regulator [Pseudoalteromonas sp. BDTF-M6]|uniref:LysR family transcriptional regulator n=1 Tax=Pseudoalteromonas sp. BDTF-M6 TaxID=2796132 RepID=UPI001BAF86A0|nr:LysR family transcriptional regulator [Pseudoalteromonas sp. BDTF-M6]MBS3797540.1 LysR family transcriptional regulator [Pseudoalteromonas sp. BDTF-M6]
MNSKITRALQVFVKTVDAGNMSHAAAQLNMTASAVSQQITKLEQDIDLSLFNRNTRKLTLTEAGEIYYASAQQLEQLQHTPSGRLKIVAPIGFGGGLLSQPIKQLTERFPKVELQLTLTDEPFDIIAAGVDLAICIGPLHDSTLIARHLADWQLIPCVSSAHPLAQTDSENPQALTAHTLIGHVNSKRLALALTHEHSRESCSLDEPKLMVNNMQTVIQLTLDGIGYGMLPEPEVRHLLAAGRLKRLCPQWHLPHYSVYAVTPHRDAVAAKTRAAIDSLRSWFEQVSANPDLCVGEN